MFSKEALDRLPPHQTYDYKIVLEEERKGHRYTPLYGMTQDELTTVKKYLEENLDS